MKKAAILIITAFYLVLNSGTLICAIHCGAAKLFAKPQMQMACTHPTKACTGCKNHDCSKKHGNVIIKENIKPGYQIRFHLPLMTLRALPAGRELNAKNAVAENIFSQQTGKAPPYSGKALAIKLRSLLI